MFLMSTGRDIVFLTRLVRKPGRLDNIAGLANLKLNLKKTKPVHIENVAKLSIHKIIFLKNKIKANINFLAQI